MRFRHVALALCLAGLASAPWSAKSKTAPTGPSQPGLNLQIQAETLHLPNGMTFILVPEKGAPVFSGYIVFKVGGVNSVPGDSGLAHMFEHMAFKGTRHIGTRDWAKEKPIFEALRKAGDKLTTLKATGKASPGEIKALTEQVKKLTAEEHKYIVKDEFDRWYTLAGERGLNASTGEDITQYFVSLPNNALELWMLMESQRIREPVMREFYSERDVIYQERLMRTENSPFGKLYEHYQATAFMAHPYRIPTIGWSSDIKALTMKQAEDFFHKYYSPSNAVGVLAGNFDVSQAKKWIDEYFGTIPRRGDPIPIVTKEPVQQEPRSVTVEYKANPMMLMGFHKPTWPDADDAVMDVISTALTDGLTSRLYKRLVAKDHLAAAVQSWNGDPGVRFDNLVTIFAVPNRGVGYNKLTGAIQSELDALAQTPMPEAELEKCKTKILADYLRQLETPMSTAVLVGHTQILTGDWHNIFKYIDQIRTMTPQDVMRVAAKYLTPSNRTMATLVAPKQAGKEAK